MSLSLLHLVWLVKFVPTGEIDKNFAFNCCMIHLPNRDLSKRQKLIYVVIYLALLAVTGIFLFALKLSFIWGTLTGAGLIILVSTFAKIGPHKMLTALVASNITLDVIAIAVWAGFPSTQWSIYQLGFTIVGAEAALAAVVYAITLCGLVKKQSWAPLLAIVMTVIQRCFATYVFFPSTAIAVTTIWSLLIIYFAIRDNKFKKSEMSASV
jgi:hypothetical protein